MDGINQGYDVLNCQIKYKKILNSLSVDRFVSFLWVNLCYSILSYGYMGCFVLATSRYTFTHLPFFYCNAGQLPTQL